MQLRRSDSRREDRFVTIRPQPFARATKLQAAVEEIMIGSAGFPLLMQMLLGELPKYRSRGKGEGCISNKHSRHCVSMDKRDARKARNRKRARA